MIILINQYINYHNAKQDKKKNIKTNLQYLINIIYYNFLIQYKLYNTS